MIPIEWSTCGCGAKTARSVGARACRGRRAPGHKWDTGGAWRIVGEIIGCCRICVSLSRILGRSNGREEEEEEEEEWREEEVGGGKHRSAEPFQAHNPARCT